MSNHDATESLHQLDLSSYLAGFFLSSFILLMIKQTQAPDCRFAKSHFNYHTDVLKQQAIYD